jgi:hypothetical protein
MTCARVHLSTYGTIVKTDEKSLQQKDTDLLFGQLGKSQSNSTVSHILESYPPCHVLVEYWLQENLL